MKKSETSTQAEEAKNFQEAVKKFVSVPKSEIDRREAEWREKQAEQKAMKEKPKRVD